MTSPNPSHLTERRVRNVEQRVGDLEETVEAHEATFYKLNRRLTKTELIVTSIATHLGLSIPTDAEIDAALDEQ